MLCNVMLDSLSCWIMLDILSCVMLCKYVMLDSLHVLCYVSVMLDSLSCVMLCKC